MKALILATLLMSAISVDDDRDVRQLETSKSRVADSEQLESSANQSASRKKLPGSPEAEDGLVPIQLRVRVLRGSAKYVMPEGGPVQRLRPLSEPLWTSKGIYMEFGVATSVELIWNGAGSARIEGPAKVSWKRTDQNLTNFDAEAISRRHAMGEDKLVEFLSRDLATGVLSLAEPTREPKLIVRGQPVRLELGFLRSAEIEAHGPGIHLAALDAGWTLDLSSGALRIEGRKDLRMRIAHHGGEPVRVRSQLDRAPGRWPVRIYSGDRVLLPAPGRK